MDKVSFNTCIAHARVGNEHCIGILKARLHSLKEIRTQLRNARENAYVIRWIRCCIILHNFLIWRNDEWSDEDHPIELERDADIRPPPEGIRDVNRRGIQRRQEAGAPLHFELYTEEDEDNYMRWKWISKKEAHRVLRGIDATLLQRSGLHDALWMDWSRPEEGTEFVKEFVLNWDDDRKQSTVDGQVIPVNVDVIRNVFGLAEGRTAPRSARHYEDLSDWVHERSKSHKTWFANDVFLPEWRPIIQLINVVLLGKQKPLEVTGAFIYILKNKVGPANLNEDMDWASYFSEKIREEISAGSR
ncbi:hypothetical protein R1sor_022671 [Riccia sorocarpa]|uniref:DDE Tnp4 domain-containing protein n=1 Tax=Riccia sorocarpa TaxID=122646 RepID=A0ABD3GNP9_9MARC